MPRTCENRQTQERTMYLSKPGSRGSRKAKRVRLQIPLTVTGLDEHGTPFAARVLTANLAEDGGCFFFNRDLLRDQFLKIQGKNGRRFLAKVRWCTYYIKEDTRRVGFQPDPNSKNGWVIGAPQK
jgi:hypothetical protein